MLRSFDLLSTMDSTLLQLFTAEEILSRLSEKECTGALHVFTSKESANLFLDEGLIVGAVKGLVEGEEVVRQILGWSEARFMWQGDVTPATPPAKPLKIHFDDLLEKFRASPKIEIGGKKLSDTALTRAEASGKTGDSTKIPLKAKPPRTGPLLEKTAAHLAGAKSLTATKQINPSQGVRNFHEEALLKKHPLVLIGEGEASDGMRLRLVQLSSLIGRNPACDFPLDHTSISRQHCLLQITDRGLHVRDLGTTNGTRVNGIVLTEGYINVGDTLQMGHLSFFVEKDESEV
jgi:FHA domain-containing protein/uncharacterized protein DUF4388